MENFYHRGGNFHGLQYEPKREMNNGDNKEISGNLKRIEEDAVDEETL
jgi:hypothetical protein